MLITYHLDCIYKGAYPIVWPLLGVTDLSSVYRGTDDLSPYTFMTAKHCFRSWRIYF